MLCSVWAASALAAVNLFGALHCFWHRTSRTALLTAHWVLVNLAMASAGVPCPADLLSLPPLLPLATVFLLLDRWLLLRRPVSPAALSPVASLFLALSLLCLDTCCVLVYREAAQPLLIAVLSLLVASLALLVYWPRPGYATMNHQKRVLVGECDLFVDRRDPLQCLGRLGTVHAGGILAGTAIQLLLLSLPAFPSSSPLLSHSSPLPLVDVLRVAASLIYVARSVGTLSIIFTPAFIGGWIQCIKETGKMLADFNAKRTKTEALLSTDDS